MKMKISVLVSIVFIFRLASAGFPSRKLADVKKLTKVAMYDFDKTIVRNSYGKYNKIGQYLLLDVSAEAFPLLSCAFAFGAIINVLFRCRTHLKCFLNYRHTELIIAIVLSSII